MYALYSCVGKAKGNTLRAQSILVQGHAYTGNPWPHPPDTVTQQHHLVSTQLVLSESFMSAYSQQAKKGAPHAELSNLTTSTLSASLKVDSVANRQVAVVH